jgi:hypothetical protein
MKDAFAVDLNGGVAVVTGAGRAIVVRLGEAGAPAPVHRSGAGGHPAAPSSSRMARASARSVESKPSVNVP